MVVPTLNEAPNIGPFLRALHAALSATGSAFEIVVVDDESLDGTADRAVDAARELPGVRVVRRTGERGLASAVVHGWRSSTGEFLATINADFQHPPDVLARMFALAGDADLVVASRYCAGGDCNRWSLSRRLSSRAAWLAGRIIAPEIFRRVSDPLSGCYLVRRTALAGLPVQPTGYKTLIEILAARRTLRIAECGYSFRRRQAGRSKASPMQAARYLLQLVRLRRLCRGNRNLAAS